MNCKPLCSRLLPSGARLASTHWRHVESNPPINVNNTFQNDAPSNVPVMDILVGDMDRHLAPVEMRKAKVGTKM